MRQVVGYVDHDGRAGGAEVVERQRHHLVEGHPAVDHRQRPGLQPAHVQQVVDQPGQPVEGLVGGEQQLGVVLRATTRCRRCAGW